MEPQTQLDRLERLLEGLATESQLMGAELRGLGTGVGSLEGRFDSLEARLLLEMRERAQSTDEQLRTLTERTERLELRVDYRLEQIEPRLDGVEAGILKSVVRLDALDKSADKLTARVDVLAEDMRQRFRVVIERLNAAA